MKLPSRVAWAGIALAGLFLIGVDVEIGSKPLSLNLEVDVNQSTVDSQFQVFFDTGSGFNEVDSDTKPIAAGSTPQALIFTVPERPVRAIRIDPLMTEGTVVISAVKTMIKSSQREDSRLDLHRVTPLREIARLDVRSVNGALAIDTIAHSVDSQCQFVPVRPITGGRLAGWELFRMLFSLDLALLFDGVLAIFALWMATSKSPSEWWIFWKRGGHTTSGSLRLVKAVVSGLMIIFAWLLVQNLGRSPLVPATEPSWVATMTYAIAHRWQFGKDFILTYGPTMPLMMCSYIGSIDTFVFIGRLICKTWTFVLFLWIGGYLRWQRRWTFWLLSLVFLGGFNEQSSFSISIAIAGLLFAKGKPSDRWLLFPTLIYVVTIALIKVNFLIFALLMLSAVMIDRCWQKKWLLAVAPTILFVVCFCTEWSLLGQSLKNLPLYFRGSFELVNGFAQAMSLPPESLVLGLGLCMALAATGQLLVLLLPAWRPNWTSIPMAGLLAGGLLLSWKGGFARADGHVLDWMTYAVVSVAVAPAFFPGSVGLVNRRLDWVCLSIALFAGYTCLERLNPMADDQIGDMFRNRARASLQGIFHPREIARAEKEAIVQNRLAYAMPKTRAIVGNKTVDVFCDEQAIAILNGLNYRPRPCFLGYSTYTPWLMNLDLAFYRSRQAPEYVLFKLQSIDNRLPTMQNAPLLIVLAEDYDSVLVENGYTLFRRHELRSKSFAPETLTLLMQGDISFGDTLVLPLESSVWCKLEVQETLLGKLLRNFYQQPALNLLVTSKEGGSGVYRLVPKLAASGFLMNPLPTTDEEFLRWQSGQHLKPIHSISLLKSPPISGAFVSKVHYKFYQISVPHVLK